MASVFLVGLLGRRCEIMLAFLRVCGYNKAYHICRCDGIGRRTGLKIPRWRHRAGSTPATGTKSQPLANTAFARDFLYLQRFSASSLYLICESKYHLKYAFKHSPSARSTSSDKILWCVVLTIPSTSAILRLKVAALASVFGESPSLVEDRLPSFFTILPLNACAMSIVSIFSTFKPRFEH